jgi:ferritin-like metal-binding protein YciE
MATQSKSAGSSRESSSAPGQVGREQLQELFVDELKDIYWAEKTLTKAIPKMIKNATCPELKSGLESHLEETEGHVSRLEQIFEIMGKKAQAKKCEAMAGLTKEAEELMEENEEGPMRDAAIISAGQKVEHYEIATYGTLKAFAGILGLDEVADILDQTLTEEKAADEKLTEVTPKALKLKG